MNALSSEKRSKDLIAKYSEIHINKFLPYLVTDYLLLATGIGLYLFFRNWWAFVLFSIPIGIAQHALAVLGHEAVHGRVSKNRVLNDFVGNWLCFYPVGLSVSSYRDFHLPHHEAAFSSRDPEVALRKRLGSSFRPPFTLSRGFWLWALSFVGFSIYPAAIFSLSMPKGKMNERIKAALLMTALIAISAITSKLDLVALWFYAQITTYISTIRIQGWYEHGIKRLQGNRYQIPNILFRLLFPHNIWVHYEHHKYPSIPFYHLEKIRDHEKDEEILTIAEMAEKLKNGGGIFNESETAQRVA